MHMYTVYTHVTEVIYAKLFIHSLCLNMQH